jgi:PDZ domain
MLRRLVFLGLLAASSPLMASCAPSPAGPETRTTISTDEFSKTIDILGPQPSGMTQGDTSVYESHRLVTLIDKKTHTYVHFIDVETSYYNGWIDFDFASDDTAQTLRLIPIYRARPTCRLCAWSETFEIAVPDAALRAHASSRYRVKISGRGGTSMIIPFTPAMIAEQYAALDQVLAKIGPPQARAASATISIPPIVAASPAPALPPGTPQALLARNIGLSTLSVSAAAWTHGHLHGAVVLNVVPDSAAEKAGIRSGDLIVGFDGHLVESGNALQALIAKTRSHRAIKVDILRGSVKVRAMLDI